MQFSNGQQSLYRYNNNGQRIYRRWEDSQGTIDEEHYIMDGSTLLAVTNAFGAVKFWNMYGTDLIGRVTTEISQELINGDVMSESEDNNAIEEANGPLGDGYVAGELAGNYGADRDWFYFDVLGEGTLDISVDDQDIQYPIFPSI